MYIYEIGNRQVELSDSAEQRLHFLTSARPPSSVELSMMLEIVSVLPNMLATSYMWLKCGHCS